MSTFGKLQQTMISLTAAVFLIAIAPSFSKADIYRDCNQSVDLKRRLAGCSKLIERGNKESQKNRRIARVNRGNAHERLGRFDLALADFTRAIALDPRNATAYFNRGLIYQKLGQHDNAIADFTRAGERAPRDPEAYFMRALVYGSLRKHAAAISDLTEVITLNRNYAEAFYMRALFHLETGDRTKAVADLRSTLRIDPTHANARSRLKALATEF